MLKTLKLFAAYLAVMLVGAYFGFCGYMFGIMAEHSAKVHDGHVWLWNLESTLAYAVGLGLFFAPIVYDIFIAMPKNMVDNGRNAS